MSEEDAYRRGYADGCAATVRELNAEFASYRANLLRLLDLPAVIGREREVMHLLLSGRPAEDVYVYVLGELSRTATGPQ